MAELVITYDLYKVLNLDRSWDCKSIKKSILKEQSMLVKRQSATNDTEQLCLIEDRIKTIEEGVKHLCKEIKRKIYDEALDKAYKAGKIKDEVEEQLKSVFEQAKAYYRKGNIKLASKFAQEAINGQINDPYAYELLARCNWETGNSSQALNIVDKGVEIFNDDLNLIWLGARISTVGLNNYDEAQRRINILLEKDPNSAIGHSEQVYMHLHKGDEELAISEIDNYIENHPNDEKFKERAAHDLCTYAQKSCFVEDSDGGMFIADNAMYKKSLNLCNKAKSIYSDKYTNKMVENSEYFGTKQWNSWNSESIKTLSIYGLIFLVLGFLFWPFAIIAAIFLITDALLIYFSFRPYWQIFKTYVTGKMGTFETIINKFGTFMANVSYRLFHTLIKLVVAAFKGLIWLMLGGPFRH